MSLPRKDADGPDPVVACVTSIFVSTPMGCGRSLRFTNIGWESK